MTGKIAARLFPAAMGTTLEVAAMLESIYRSRERVGLALGLHFFGWIASAIGTWIAFGLMGSSVSLAPVLALESLIFATRSAAAVIPNALGVQEAAYAVLAPAFGVGAEFGLAVSVLKRARDIAISVPILLISRVRRPGGRLASRGRSHRASSARVCCSAATCARVWNEIPESGSRRS